VAPTDDKLRFNLALCLQVIWRSGDLRSEAARGGAGALASQCSAARRAGPARPADPAALLNAGNAQEWAVRVFKKQRPEGDETKVGGMPCPSPPPPRLAPGAACELMILPTPNIGVEWRIEHSAPQPWISNPKPQTLQVQEYEEAADRLLQAHNMFAALQRRGRAATRIEPRKLQARPPARAPPPARGRAGAGERWRQAVGRPAGGLNPQPCF
jgi:hypothetical protein